MVPIAAAVILKFNNPSAHVVSFTGCFIIIGGGKVFRMKRFDTFEKSIMPVASWYHSVAGVLDIDPGVPAIEVHAPLLFCQIVVIELTKEEPSSVEFHPKFNVAFVLPVWLSSMTQVFWTQVASTPVVGLTPVSTLTVKVSIVPV